MLAALQHFVFYVVCLLMWCLIGVCCGESSTQPLSSFLFSVLFLFLLFLACCCDIYRNYLALWLFCQHLVYFHCHTEQIVYWETEHDSPRNIFKRLPRWEIAGQKERMLGNSCLKESKMTGDKRWLNHYGLKKRFRCCVHELHDWCSSIIILRKCSCFCNI